MEEKKILKINKFKNNAKEINKIFEHINNLPQNNANLNSHDVHHYVAIHGIVGILLSTTVIIIYKQYRKRSAVTPEERQIELHDQPTNRRRSQSLPRPARMLMTQPEINRK